MKIYKARGIVLHTMRYGETSLIAFVLTDLLGRQNYLIQGARGGKSNKAALFQPMFVVDLVGVEPHLSQLHRLKEVSAGITMRTVPFDVRKSTIALFMAETLYRLIKEVEPHSPLFDFVLASIQALDTLDDPAAIANFHLWFLVRLSSHLGFHPGNEYTGGACFDITEGLFTTLSPLHRYYFDPHNSLILSELMSIEPTELHTLKLTRTSRATFLNAMLDYFAYHLDGIHNIRSIEILREVF